MTNKEFRKSDRYRRNADRDAAIAMRRADDVEDLMENLDDYYNLKDRDIAGKALGVMGTVGGLTKLVYMLEQRRRQAIRDRMRINNHNIYFVDEDDPSYPG